MKKILFLLPKLSDACSFYRGAGVATDLRRRGYDIETMDMGCVVDWAFLICYDIIMIQRASSPAIFNVCAQIKRMGVKLWLDYDDNLFCVPLDNPSYLVYSNKEIREAIAGCLTLADMVSVTTEDLRQSYLPYNKNIMVIPNAHNDNLIKREKRKREKIVLWRGTATHQRDISTYQEAINKVSTHWQDIKFIYVGYVPWFLRIDKNTAFASAVDTMLYLEQIQVLAPMVMQVPLHDSLFNRCKSNIAAIEGTFAGAACLVPDWWNIDGCIKYNDNKSYYEGLNAILKGDVDVEKANNKAWDYIRANLFLSDVNKQRIELIEGL
jgi:hypothetical protein